MNEPRVPVEQEPGPEMMQPGAQVVQQPPAAPTAPVPLTPEEKLEREMYSQFGESSRYQVK